MVSETSQVDITKDIQLICKYMKAYYDGTIDTIFLDGECNDIDVCENDLSATENLYCCSLR